MSNKNEFTPRFPAMQAFFKGRPNIPLKELIKRKIDKLNNCGISEFKTLFNAFIPSSVFTEKFGEDFSRNWPEKKNAFFALK